MTATRTALAALLATVALAAAACGGGSDSVPAGAIAVVDGTEVPKQDLDNFMEWSRKGYAAQKREFPKAGTPEYQSIQTQFVALLVQAAEFRQAADELGVSVSEKDVAKAETDYVKAQFDGKRAAYEKALAAQGLTVEDYRANQIALSVLAQKIFDEVTKDVKVTDEELRQSYIQSQSQYSTPESRDVRHILIAEKTDDGKVDYAASKAKADEIYAQLKGGADFAALAKSQSADPGSKDQGGKLTITRGQTVPEFDKVGFELDKGEISKPVKTTYGYHVIEAVSDVRKAKVTPFEKVKAGLRTQLLQERRNTEMQTWLENLRKDYDGKVNYAAGYEPPELPEAPTETS
jgi:parvulin-like peptidyl-prolyl isomerase